MTGLGPDPWFDWRASLFGWTFWRDTESVIAWGYCTVVGSFFAGMIAGVLTR
jgi:hypothetical protein